jgi:sugar (pentulose or hexulose) kinase
VDDIRFVAVLDIGKTNVKVLLHDLATGTDLAVRTTPNLVLQSGPYPHFDAAAIQAFFVDGLADILRACSEPLQGISITAHGASGALLGRDGLALPLLDYEHAAVEETRDAYDRIRPPFAESFSPRLPGGLNLGAQFFWQEHRFPREFADVRAIVTYPQYWAWWLTGVAATEATSLGAHTDLWNPKARRFSSLVEKAGWQDRLAPTRSAFDRLGPLRPELAGRLGLAHPVPVACGLHDSNASLLPHIAGRTSPVSVVSTGTWVICFATGGSLDGLDPARDTLANVDAFTRPVPSARFMGGREFEILAGKEAAAPTAADIAAVIERQVMVLPTFSPGNGPFPRAAGRWTHPPETLSPAERSAAASLYAGLMTATCLDLLHAQGATIIEGPFGRNRLFVEALQACTGRAVLPSPNATGTSGGAALLFRGGQAGGGAEATRSAQPDSPKPAAPGLGEPFAAYAATWKRVAEATLQS